MSYSAAADAEYTVSTTGKAANEVNKMKTESSSSCDLIVCWICFVDISSQADAFTYGTPFPPPAILRANPIKNKIEH